MKRRVAVMVIVSGLAASAYADKPASLAHYEKGKKAYAAGNFTTAVAEFEAAYAEWNTPEYLHDIGQAYRRLDKCNEAASAFEKYLAQKPDAPNRATVMQHIAELRAKCPSASTTPSASPAPSKPAQAPAAHAPATMSVPRVATVEPSRSLDTRAVATVEPNPPLDTRVVATTTAARAPNPWHPTASAGIAILDAGPVVMPPTPELSLGVLRDMPIPHSLQLGANLSIARLPFDDVMTGTVWLAGPELTASGAYPVSSRLAIIGGIGAGAQLVSGLGDGNPFTAGGMAHDSFVALRLRGELGIAWRASDRFVLRVAPGYQVMPRRAALADDIDALHGVVFRAGIALDL